MGTEALDADLEKHRKELTAHCYRMLGSAFEAEDAVQETMVRAWRGLGSFEGRSSLRSWLYRIATNICLDMAGAGQRRARPMDLTSPGTPQSAVDEGLPEAAWVGPAPDAMLLSADPAEAAIARESVRLAFIAALQKLPAKQRAVLILRDVLAWSAAETAQLLELSVPAANSALQRARATLAADRAPAAQPDPAALGADEQRLLDQYLDAFERFDIPALTGLLHEDAVLNMPPIRLWLRGAENLAAWWAGTGGVCRGSRLLPVRVNGGLGFAQYHDGGATPWAIQVVECAGGRITAVTYFLDTPRLFPLFGVAPNFAENAEPAG
jgi:RNA polymerase sigma-70 factor (ECF subfamily)